MAQDYVEIVSQGIVAARGSNPKNVFNVWHYRRSFVGGISDKSVIEAMFQTTVMTPILALVNLDYTQTYNTVRFFDDALDAPIAFAETGVGAGTGDRMETFVSAVIQGKSNTKGRFARSSKHLAPMSEGDSVGDVWNATALTNLAAVATAWRSGFTDGLGNVWVPIVKSNHIPAQYKVNPVTVVAYDIVSTVVNKTAGTMKRRKVKPVYV